MSTAPHLPSFRAHHTMPFTQGQPVGGGQSLTIFNGGCLADLLKIQHRERLQNLFLLHSFFQEALLDHR